MIPARHRHLKVIAIAAAVTALTACGTTSTENVADPIGRQDEPATTNRQLADVQFDVRRDPG